MLPTFTHKHSQTLTNTHKYPIQVPNAHANIIQPGKYQKMLLNTFCCMTRNGPGLQQDVTKIPDSPGTRIGQDQDSTRMLQGVTRNVWGSVKHCIIGMKTC